MANLVVFNLFGGMALLLYGMKVSSEGMQQAAGARLRQILGTLTSNRILGVLVGAVTTILMQSSSATTVMLVGFVSSGFMGLGQTIPVILGADIGTTVTVQLLAFRITDYALLLVGVGATLMLATSQRVYRYFGQALLGFGLLFLGLKVMIDAMAPLKESALFQEVVISLGSMPLLLIVIAAALAALLHSSAATIGLAVALGSQGLITLDAALPIVFGANVGTCATALVSSIGSTAQAQRVAVAHCLFKVLGVAIFLPFVGPLVAGTRLTAHDLPRQIANAHTFFNATIALIFLPLSNQFAHVVTRLVPERKDVDPFRPRYLDLRVLESPPLALGEATRETLRMADVVQEMLRDALEVFRADDVELLRDVQKRDDQVDALDRAIKGYLTQLSEHALSEEQSKKEIGLLYVINDLENIGDLIDKNLMMLGIKKIEGKHRFSGQGWDEIQSLHQQVAENLDLAVAAFAAQDPQLAQQVIKNDATLSRTERELRQSHIQRLHQGTKESVDTSEIHLDILNNFRRINTHVSNIAFVVLGEL